ncbi:MAG: DUF192 domain-containing protein [Deltaproteobacteria bacterium]|nr:DUF192 domain-containing protein [Deltaproteobacteria bacterium]
MVRTADNRVIADPCVVADTIVSRFKGLMGRPSLDAGHGLLIEPCNSIHTFFMRFAIDVVYLGRGEGAGSYKVMVVRAGVKPWRMDFPIFGAKAVLELPNGGAANLREGDTLCLLS